MDLIFKYPHFVVMLLAYVLSDLCVSLSRRIGTAVGAEDVPGTQDYKVQKNSTPFLGGVGLFIGFFLALATTLDWEKIATGESAEFFASDNTKIAIAVLLGGATTAILGLIDDFRPVHAGIKLAALFGITLVVTHLGLSVDFVKWMPAVYLVTLLWFAGVTSCFNAIDNTDGVAGVTAVSVCLFTFAVAWSDSAEHAQESLSYLSIALAAAVLGFLRHNRPTARIYLGNTGAFSLGFFLAVMAIHSAWTPNTLHSLFVPILLLSYPIFDMGYTTFMRWRAGIVKGIRDAIVVSGRDHTAHRLTALGLGPWKVLAVIGALNFVSGMVAFSIMRLAPATWLLWSLVALVVVMYGLFGYWIRNAVDLRSANAKISHRRPVTSVTSEAQLNRRSKDSSDTFPSIPLK